MTDPIDLSALIAAVREDHQPWPTATGEQICDGCKETWPCPSNQLADAAETLAASRSPSSPQGLEPTFAAFSATNRERCESPSGFNHQLGSWSTSDWFTAVVGELGEAANVAKKLNRIRDGIPGNKETEAELREKLRRELADSFVYLDLLAQALGFNIGAAAVDVFNAKSDEIGCPIRLAVDGPQGAQE
jgi:NTP pyrophosphatase (non-canonical NTP hydrolase)